MKHLRKYNESTEIPHQQLQREFERNINSIFETIGDDFDLETFVVNYYPKVESAGTVSDTMVLYHEYKGLSPFELRPEARMKHKIYLAAISIALDLDIITANYKSKKSDIKDFGDDWKSQIDVKLGLYDLQQRFVSSIKKALTKVEAEGYTVWLNMKTSSNVTWYAEIKIY